MIHRSLRLLRWTELERLSVSVGLTSGRGLSSYSPWSWKTGPEDSVFFFYWPTDCTWANRERLNDLVVLFFPSLPYPLRHTSSFLCQRPALTRQEFLLMLLHLTLLILKKASHVSLCGAGRGREGECWDLIWRCELRGVLMMKCGREWWMCVRIKSASGSWADQTGRGLGLSLSLSLPLSLSLLANMFREGKRRTDAPSKMLYFPFIRPCHFCFELFSFFSNTHKLFSIDSGIKKYLGARATR